MIPRARAATLLMAGLIAMIAGGPAWAQTPSGPIAAWGFDEANGTVAGDGSGNGNVGTIVGAAWTSQGRFGSALVFNGTSSRVLGPSVTLGPAFTLMAWVLNPSQTAYGTMITVGGTRDFYLGGGLTTFYTGSADLTFGSALANGVWHHVAVVSDGTTLRAYLNGAPWGAAPATALGAVTGPLQVGAWISGVSNADYFVGTIDEVRVYNRALDQAEIQTLMSIPVGTPPADTTPPVRSAGQPTGTLPVGTTQTTLSLTTEENATCRYGTTPGVAYGSMPTTFVTTAGTAHSTPVSGLVNGGAYSVYVRCQDTAANANTTDFTISFSVGNTPGSGYALRFYGNGTGDIDRVKIRIDNPERPADIGATDFTLEFWMKAIAAENASASCSSGDDGWIWGNTIFDRDVSGAGDFGDFGISLAGGRIAFGVNNEGSGAGICTTQNVADGVWHHIAVTRSRSTGQLRIFVDGLLDADGPGPLGDLSYRNGRPTSAPNDPYLVIGAEKHDAGRAWPAYSGWIDEVRLSNLLRYTAAFPRPSAPFTTDPNTVALYHFDEGGGNLIADSSGAPGGPSDGLRSFGGTPQGPDWVTDTPFVTPPPDTAVPR